MMSSYWPWWLGAAALASVAVGFAAALRRPFGVSGIYARLLNWREERQAEQTENRLLSQRDAVREALVAATRERFGDEAVEAPGGANANPAPAQTSALPVSVGLTFLLFVFLGGAVSSLARHETGLHFSLGADFERLVGAGWTAWLALMGGGCLVGFGTRMAGGCTSGHGLFGCSRLQPASLVATAAFFGAGVVVSLVLGAL